MDLYASEIDKKGLSEGWFVDTMPELNQRNPYMAEYLIQNSNHLKNSTSQLFYKL